MVQSITTFKLEELLSSEDIFVLDVRPSAAFNGWQATDNQILKPQ
jgi:rhodanese-related sulfurtransferase